MRFGQIALTVRQVLPIFLCFSVNPAIGMADKDFPNELNSPIDEPRILLPDSSRNHNIQAISMQKSHLEDPLVKLVFETREAQRRRLLSTSVHTPWQIMHGLLALRQDFIISHNDKSVSGLDWVSAGPTFRNEYWFEKTQFGGRAHPYSVPYAFEGHINQFLAILSMSGLGLDHEFGTANGKITMRDMLTNAQRTVNEKEEITWTLWALSRYLPPDAQWQNSKGEHWSIERLVKLQTDKPLQGTPCGGTHGLFALAHARNVYLRKGEPLRGVWLEAEHKIRKYISTARMQQNSDGTLSSNFFRGREYKEDFDKRMASAGHILEFLMIAMPQEELSEPWVRRAIEATCRDLMKNRHDYVSCSPLYHTVNGLTIYLERVAAADPPEKLAADKEKTRTISSPKELKTAEVPPPAKPTEQPAAKAVQPPATPTAPKVLSETPVAAEADSRKSPVVETEPSSSDESDAPPPLTIPPISESESDGTAEEKGSKGLSTGGAAPTEIVPTPVPDSTRLSVRTEPDAAGQKPMPVTAPEMPSAEVSPELVIFDSPSTIQPLDIENVPLLKPVPMGDDEQPSPAPSETVSQLPSSVPPSTESPGMSRSSTDLYLNASNQPRTVVTRTTPASSPPEERKPETKHWKATPLERRRSIVVTDQNLRR